MQKRSFIAALMLPAVLISSSANAAAIDVTSVLTGITSATAAITTVGTAILAVCVLIAAFTWVRRPIK